MSVQTITHKASAPTYKVVWRAPGCGRKCPPTCTRVMHQHTRTFTDLPEATRYDEKMRDHVSLSRELGGPIARNVARPGSVRTFKALALATIVDRQERGKWSAGTARGMRTALGKLGSWADQSIADASVDLRGAQSIVSAAKYPDRIISIIKSTCDHAVRSGDIETHAMSALEADRSRMPEARRDFILTSPDQLATVCAVLDTYRPGLGLALELMRFCGLRTGEALGVQAEDFSESYSILRVSRQVDCDGKVATLKSKRADDFRIVPVPPALSVKLAKHCADLDRARLFAGKNGGAVDRSRFGEKCRDGAAAAGLDQNWTAYQCRHQYASTLISRNVPIDRVAKMLGHASTAITFRVYSHLMPGDLDSIRDAAA